MIKFIAKLLISASIMFFLIRGSDFPAIIEHLKTANPSLLVFASGLLFFLIIPQAWRWQSIIQVSGAKLKYRSAVVITLVGWFFNQVLPSSVGGDAFRVWYARLCGVDLSTSAQSVILDRISALMAVTFLLILSMPWLSLFFSSNEPVISILIFVFLLVTGCVFMMTADRTVSIILPAPLRGHIEELACTSRKVFLSRTGVKVISLSLLIHFFVACVVWLLAMSMNIPLSLVHALLLMPVILFISAIPISIAGWGLRESAMVFVFGMIGMPVESAFSLSVSLGLVLIVTGLPGGIAWWFMHYEFPKGNEEQQAMR